MGIIVVIVDLLLHCYSIARVFVFLGKIETRVRLLVLLISILISILISVIILIAIIVIGSINWRFDEMSDIIFNSRFFHLNLQVVGWFYHFKDSCRGSS